MVVAFLNKRLGGTYRYNIKTGFENQVGLFDYDGIGAM